MESLNIMKRIIPIAMVAAMACGAYAQENDIVDVTPDVFDYKASVRHTDLKEIRVGGLMQSQTVAVKYIKSSTLFGYLIAGCANCEEEIGTGFGYLVVANRRDKVPVILPADLLAKAWPANGLADSRKWISEGYLFVGDGTNEESPWGTYLTWSTDDYGASSRLLFGKYNREDLTEGDPIFADTWMSAAGFGLAVNATTCIGCGTDGDICEEPEIGELETCVRLDTLCGSVIGGMFLCIQSPFEIWLCGAWAQTGDVISGSWSIKRNTRLQPIAITPGNTLGDATVDAYVNAAIKKIRAAATFDDVVPSDADAPDFPRFF